MGKMQQPARYDRYEYSRSGEGYFKKTSGDSRLPDELRIEAVRADDKYRFFGVDEWLTARQKNGRTAFKTGLQKCSTQNFFSGDVLEQGMKSLVAVALTEERNRLTVFVFRGFYKHLTRQRLNFVRDFLMTHTWK